MGEITVAAYEFPGGCTFKDAEYLPGTSGLVFW